MKIGIVGLGRMGMNIAKRLIEKGHSVVAYNRTPAKTETLMRETTAEGAFSLRELVERLLPPRVVWLMLPAGKPTEEHINRLGEFLNSGDIVVDGANGHYSDTKRRHELLKQRGISLLDVGVSGGLWGLKEGYCLMIGGDKEKYEYLVPLFEALAQKDGYLYCGPSGAGHYVKMVHNGIEYALMQAYAEGFELLKHSPYGELLKLVEVAHLWQHGSVIRSWLLELLERALRKDEGLKDIKAYVEDSGEGRWTVIEAIEREVPLPTITLSLFKRFRSRQKDPFSEKILAALRAEFGGHRVLKKDE